MNNNLKEITLAVLLNNETILDQVEEFNKRSGDDGRSTEHLRKIYDGIRAKLNANEDLTQADCKFLVIAMNITQASLQRQLRTVSTTIEMYNKLQEIYSRAAESEENLQDLLNAEIDVGDVKIDEDSEESAESNI